MMSSSDSSNKVLAQATRKPVIHIGMPKTATKTLQWRLFSRHSEIFYLGRFDGPQFQKQHKPLACCRDQATMQLMNQIAYNDVFQPDFQRCCELLNGLLAEAREANKVPVWSWESYSTDILAKRRIRARNLKRVFGEATIIMALRHPLVLLESAYFQQLKRDNVSPSLKFGRPPFYLPMDQWLEKNFHGEILPHLQFGETVQAYVEQFGLENVHVFLFEDLVKDEDAFFRRVCHVMQIDADEGATLIQGERDNERWTTRQVDILKRVVSSPLMALKFRLLNHSQRMRLLELQSDGTPAVRSEKAIAPISQNWKKEIFNAVAPGAKWLMDNFQLPLDKYGYMGTEYLDVSDKEGQH
jgi:hypothetical protein